MGKIELKQGDRKIINGVEMAYHGNFGALHDFVRPVDNGRKIEYCLFANLKTNKNGKLFGKVVETFITKPFQGYSIVCGSSSDLYSRGLDVWQIKERRAA